MFYIQLYAFSKNKNSTKQPTGTGQQLSCLMKTGSSIIDPVVTVKDNPSAYNYAYIPTFNRYYFIRDIAYVLGEWEISLSSDPLASFKSAIGSTYAYVLRSASAYTSLLKDDLYDLSGAYTENVQTWTPFDISATGYYYITVLSSGAEPHRTYRLTPAAFGEFVKSLLGYGTDSTLWASTVKGIQNSAFNPIQFITNVYWCPYDFSMSAGTANSIKVGNYDVGIGSNTANFVNGFEQHVTKSFTLTAHPQASARGNYCNLSPYSEHIISSGFGNLQVPADLLSKTTNKVNLDIAVDTRTGTAVLIAKANNIRFARVTSSIGIEVPLAQIGRNTIAGMVSLLSAVSSGVAGALTGNIGMVAAGLGGAVSSAVEAGRSLVSTTGAMVSAVNLFDAVTCTSVYHTIADADNTNNGRPYCKYVSVSALSGYLQCAKGTFKSTTATESEIDTINAYMVSGFYYE